MLGSTKTFGRWLGGVEVKWIRKRASFAAQYVSACDAAGPQSRPMHRQDEGALMLHRPHLMEEMVYDEGNCNGNLVDYRCPL